MSKHWEKHRGVRTGDQLKFRERAADALKLAFGTWTLLFLIVGGIIFWLGFVKDPGELHLNLALSFLASVQGVILQIAANRGDRISAEVALHTQANTDELTAHSVQLVTMNQQQLEILGRLDGLTEQVSGLADAVRASAIAVAESAAKPRARKPAGKDPA